jgi:vanillate/4-hydroxybenzoate decarboxylase subunit D
MSQGQTTTSPPLSLERQPVEGSCPRCGAEDIRSYPVNSEGGWFQVAKCQNCLLSVSRERWTRLGPIQLLSDSL